MVAVLACETANRSRSGGSASVVGDQVAEGSAPEGCGGWSAWVGAHPVTEIRSAPASAGATHHHVLCWRALLCRVLTGFSHAHRPSLAGGAGEGPCAGVVSKLQNPRGSCDGDEDPAADGGDQQRQAQGEVRCCPEIPDGDAVLVLDDEQNEQDQDEQPGAGRGPGHAKPGYCPRFPGVLCGSACSGGVAFGAWWYHVQPSARIGRFVPSYW